MRPLRNLYRAAIRQRDTQNEIVNDAMRSQREHEEAKKTRHSAYALETMQTVYDHRTLMIVLFGTVSLVATLNPFLANTISTVLGGERRVLQSGDPNAVQYYDKTASFKQFDPGIKDFERNAQGQELSSEQKKQAQMAAGMLNQEICEEGFVLLKNESQALPLTEGAMHVSVFGKNSANLVLGG